MQLLIWSHYKKQHKWNKGTNWDLTSITLTILAKGDHAVTVPTASAELDQLQQKVMYKLILSAGLYFDKTEWLVLFVDHDVKIVGLEVWHWEIKDISERRQPRH